MIGRGRPVRQGSYRATTRGVVFIFSKFGRAAMTPDEAPKPLSKPRVPPPKRTYEKHEHDKDVDLAKRARTIKMVGWSLAIGAVAGNFGAQIWNPAIGVLAFLFCFLFTFTMTNLFSEGAGAVAGTIYHPSGKSTPPKREYSYPESLVARGHYEEAVTAYQLCCADFPDDPEPYVRIARLYRDKLEKHEDALFWFKRARSDAQVDKGRELLITQEIIEIYTGKLDVPQKAIPELARLVDRFPQDPVADWAKEEIKRLREAL